MRVLTVIVDVSNLTEEQIISLEDKMVNPTEEFDAPILNSEVKDIDEGDYFDETAPEHDLESDPSLH